MMGEGALYCGDNSYVTFDKSVSVQFVNNSAQVGGAIHSPQNCDCIIAFDGNSSVTFASNRADNNGGAMSGSATITFDENASTIFVNNVAAPVEDYVGGRGGAISVNYSSILFNGSTSIKFDNNKASDDGGAIYGVSSAITSDNNASITFLNNRVTSTVTYTGGRGGAISVIYSSISFNGSTSIKYDANTAYYSGGAIYGVSSAITSDGFASITFLNNRAISLVADGGRGGAISVSNYSSIIVNGNTSIQFEKNTAPYSGGAIYGNDSAIIFDGNASITFLNNRATSIVGNGGRGGAISVNYSSISFNGSTSIKFDNNKASDDGGAIYGVSSTITSDNNVSITFLNNRVTSTVTYTGGRGGAISVIYSSISFNGSTSIKYDANTAYYSGGAIYGVSSAITSDGFASITFLNNRAISLVADGGRGGAISVSNYSSIIVNGNTSIQFEKNTAPYCGGAIYGNDSAIIFDGNASITFLNNRATSIVTNGCRGVVVSVPGYPSITMTRGTGGAICISGSNISFNGNTSVEYLINVADDSGAIYGDNSTIIICNGNASIIFLGNRAYGGKGGAISVSNYSSIIVNGNTSIQFEKNTASYCGGAIYGNDSAIIFDGNASITFLNNSATSIVGNGCRGVVVSVPEYPSITMTRGTGGAICISGSNISFNGNTSVKYLINIADDSGAIYGDNSTIIICNGNASIIFLGNRAYGGKGGAIRVMKSNIIFNGSSSIKFDCNEAAIGGAIYGSDTSTVISDGNASITFVKNRVYTNQGPISEGKGGAVNINMSVIVFNGSTLVKFNNNQADYGGAIYGTRSNTSFNGKNMSAMFINNYASVNGGAVHGDDSTIVFDGNMSIIFHGNHADQYGGAIGVHSGSNVKFDGKLMSATFENNNAGMNGGAVHGDDSTIVFDGNMSIIFHGNHADQYGGAIGVYSGSRVKFDGKLMSATFDNNNAGMNGGAIYGVHTDITFNGKKLVEFVRNNADDSGGGIHGQNSNIFYGNMSVTFANNCANNDGSAMYAVNSNITFDGDVSVMFHDNCKANRGGAFYGEGSNILFNGNASGMFINNSATKGGAYYGCSTVIKFSGGTSVKFVTNFATDGGAICGIDHSEIIFDENTEVQFSRNTAATHGAAVYISTNSSVTSSGDSIINFAFNSAVEGGGALYSSEPNIILNENTSQSVYASSIIFSGNSTTLFSSNTATRGGVVCSLRKSSISFHEDSTVNFSHNIGTEGGALYLEDDVGVSFDGNTSVIFTNNSAETGGAIYARMECYIVFDVNSQVNFSGNRAKLDGGAIAFVSSSIVSFTGNLLNYKIARQNSNASMKDAGIRFCGDSSVTLQSNEAMQCGGAIYSFSSSVIIFEGDSNVTFNNNKAEEQGGAVYLTSQSVTFFIGNSQVVFESNEASLNGGAIGSLDDGLIYTGDASNLTFYKNSCSYFGGAIYLFENTTANFSGYSKIKFEENTATSGGAMYLDNNFTLSFDDYSSVTYLFNYVDQYGGAVYGNLVGNINSKIIVNATFNHTHFKSNTASSGPNIYMDIPITCDKKCLNQIIVDSSYDDFSDSNFTDYIRTQPSKLVLNNTAKCVHHGNDSDMKLINSTYLVEGIMLGQEIITDACVLDHFNNTASATRFTVNSNNETYHIYGPDVILISCDKLRGIRIIGSEVSSPINVSMTITSQIDSQSEFKKISIQLITELSPCHPGFHYSITSQRCDCYDETDIVTCSDNYTSTIKRGYWFGKSPGSGKATVSVCPKNYCSFDCCEATNGYYQLFPERHNQCNSHRFGTACGSCEEGYTLSFDSVVCVRGKKCPTGQTVMVVTLSMIYWIVIVILVFIMTYYHVGIGYLYAITYYYSMLDILLDQNLYIFQGLFTTVSIFTSIAKITPRFLGQLCLVENMSGIDQQFVHYVHPLAVTIIVVLLCLSARISYRFSTFVSRGIIRVICYLLLLSYTSVATTSLLLLRSLTFDNVDKVFTYLSPDIEYCHGRHLPYFIVAVLCTLVIVIGLPLLLLLEPFLNYKINFTRMKPLLDQFQGCYKDKYRCFAAYYMICRLVIIVIIIANPTLNITVQFLQVALCTMLALIQLIIRPYVSNILNIFDGFVLQIMILVSIVPLIESYDQNLLLSVAFVLIALPLIAFAVMELFIHKNGIKKISRHIHRKPNSATDHRNYLLMDNVAPTSVKKLNR